MRPINVTQTLFAAVAFTLASCTQQSAIPPQAPSPAQPNPDQTTEQPESSNRPKTQWAFRYSPNTYSYTINTTPSIAQFPDTSNFRILPTASETVAIAVTDTGMYVVSPPLPESLRCDEVNALIIRARELIPQIPTNLETGMTWTDSSTTEGCRGSIPTVSTAIRTYLVVGDTLYNDEPALLIQKTETISAKGEGNEGQHRVLMTATGSGTANLYFNVLAGSFLGMTGTQTSDLSITASGRVSRFLQRIVQTVRLSN